MENLIIAKITKGEQPQFLEKFKEVMPEGYEPIFTKNIGKAVLVSKSASKGLVKLLNVYAPNNKYKICKF